MAPEAMASIRGFGVPPSAPRIASTEKPAIIRTGSTGMRTRSGLRLGYASTAIRTIWRAISAPWAGSNDTCVAPGNFALSEVEMTWVW